MRKPKLYEWTMMFLLGVLSIGAAVETRAYPLFAAAEIALWLLICGVFFIPVEEESEEE